MLLSSSISCFPWVRWVPVSKKLSLMAIIQKRQCHHVPQEYRAKPSWYRVQENPRKTMTWHVSFSSTVLLTCFRLTVNFPNGNAHTQTEMESRVYIFAKNPALNNTLQVGICFFFFFLWAGGTTATLSLVFGMPSIRIILWREYSARLYTSQAQTHTTTLPFSSWFTFAKLL